MRHFTLLLLSVFTVYQAKADILIPLDKYPTGEKRFNLQINGSHDTSTPWLSTTSFGVDEDGQMGNPENWTSEQIDEDNHSVSHRLIMNSISLRLSYRVWDNLSLWAGIGTTNFTHEETFRDDDDLSNTVRSHEDKPPPEKTPPNGRIESLLSVRCPCLHKGMQARTRSGPLAAGL